MSLHSSISALWQAIITRNSKPKILRVVNAPRTLTHQVHNAGSFGVIMVTLLQTLASRLSFFALLLIVLGVIATPLPMFEALNDTAGLLERRDKQAVRLYLKHGYYESDGTFFDFTGPATRILHRNDEFILFFSHPTEGVWGLRAIEKKREPGDESLEWKLKPVHGILHLASDLLLGTLTFPSEKKKVGFLGPSGLGEGNKGGIYEWEFPGSDALQVYNQIIQLDLGNYFAYEPNPHAWEDFYQAVNEPNGYRGKTWNVKALLGQDLFPPSTSFVAKLVQSEIFSSVEAPKGKPVQIPYLS
ncbi:hypothetical protein F5876DRAFT_66428 [Lentinula aff. lateritia]|uniref:Uncharacterized protein n=1 Tax=Lentinula aff. lateritia TaxID=2804960 RepID=A0ACC1TXJ0_9AGAR|nr:hypothetical protein F5876DRAFT_66428 [Lentinula aff. lateritia]